MLRSGEVLGHIRSAAPHALQSSTSIVRVFRATPRVGARTMLSTRHDARRRAYFPPPHFSRQHGLLKKFSRRDEREATMIASRVRLLLVEPCGGTRTFPPARLESSTAPASVQRRTIGTAPAGGCLAGKPQTSRTLPSGAKPRQFPQTGTTPVRNSGTAYCARAKPRWRPTTR